MNYHIILINLKVWVFNRLNDILGEDSFKKYSDSKHKGAFLVGAFQAIASGIYTNIDNVQKMTEDKIRNKVRAFYHEKAYIDSTNRGVRAVPRFCDLTRFGKEYFNNEN